LNPLKMTERGHTGADDFLACWSLDDCHRTMPLRDPVARSNGGYYHDGRLPNLNPSSLTRKLF